MNFFKRTQPNEQHARGALSNSEGSASIVSPPGAGKTATTIVVDPPIELCSMTHIAGESLDNDLYVACPHPDDANEILHPDHRIVDCGINIFGRSELKGKPESVRENVKNRVEPLLPDNVKTDANTRFFEIDGRDLLELTCLDELNRGRDITLPNLRERILSGPAELNEASVEAMER